MATPSADTAVRYFIACYRAGAAIHGIGHTPDEAAADAYSQSGTDEPQVSAEGDEWVVTLSSGRVEKFDSEDEAREYAEEHAYIVRECTPALYEHVEKHGTPSRWTENDAGLQDVEQEDEAD